MPLTDKQKVGNTGEDVVVKFLMKQGFSVLDRNYRRKWGELDIVAKNKDILHFIEVKTVVSCGTNPTKEQKDWFRPEENVHPWKLKRLARIIQTYLIDKKVSCETEWQIDIASVFLNLETRKARIRWIKNVII